MHPPEWVTEELYNIHPQARLGWVGYPKEENEETLNKGTFVLLQLYHKKDVNRVFGVYPWKDFPNKGPLFGRAYDPLIREPVALAFLEPQDVFSGKVVSMLKEWIRPMQTRVRESALQAGKDAQSDLDDNVESAADFMTWNANKSYDKPNIVAKKHLTKDEKALLSGDKKTDVKEMFLPPKLQSGD